MFAIQIFIVFFVFVSNNYFIILIVLYCMITHTYIHTGNLHTCTHIQHVSTHEGGQVEIL